MFYIVYPIKKNFSVKGILKFFQLFYSNFNLLDYVRKKLYICDDNLLRFGRILALK